MTGLNAQTVHCPETAFAQSVGYARLKQRRPQLGGDGICNDEFVAMLAAVADASDPAGGAGEHRLDKPEVAQAADIDAAQHAFDDCGARCALECDHRLLSRAVI